MVTLLAVQGLEGKQIWWLMKKNNMFGLGHVEGEKPIVHLVGTELLCNA